MTEGRPPVAHTGLTDLVERLVSTAELAAAHAQMVRAEPVTVDGVWGSSAALLVAIFRRWLTDQAGEQQNLAASGKKASAKSPPRTLVVVLPREKEVDAFAADLQSFLGDAPSICPAWETLPDELQLADPILGKRIRIAQDLASASPPPVLLTTIQALTQPIPSAERRDAATRILRVGEELDLEQLLGWLTERGFDRVPAVDLAGEFSVHGGILDIFPPGANDPIRIELFGDEIESIRSFELESQRKLRDLNDVAITAVGPLGGESMGSDGEHLLDALPTGSWVILLRLAELVDEGKTYLTRVGEASGLFSIEASLGRCQRFPWAQFAPLMAESSADTVQLRVSSIERFGGARGEALNELAQVLASDERVLIACHNAGTRDRLAELLTEAGIEVPGPDGTAQRLIDRVDLRVGFVAQGFRLVQQRLVVLSDNELFGRTEVRRPASRRRLETRAIDSFIDLSEGDLIVHLSHGIGRFRGMEILTKDGHQQEHLHLEFRDGVRMYVPVTLIHLVQKYIGGTKQAPELSKVGGISWQQKKQRAAAAVSDMAADMLRLQAERDSQPGLACPPDSHWQREFEAAFPYTETEDQLRAIADVKQDLELSRPMDRLICGDVGYGKTEVAMRAAFKAVDAGRQVAVLVPTTVLAEQHMRSFSERMAEFPVSLASLSRFRTKSEQRDILARLAEGKLDIVIGTHRLVQPDVRFKDLGLLVIDEEQRFGVEAKEMLKRLRLEVDVLTLSATPIPRTLHLSLLGVRDISNLETAPRDRVAVETHIARFDRELVRHAIIRELNRDGQIYFVHNRVYNIQTIAERLRSLVPEATVDIVHGQMNEDELERAMLGFVNGSTDILVATTIIESGLDIPNANTIFIHQAENYGLADLHQLRGRVGRYRHRAYCYLLVEEGKQLTPQAARRLKAVEEYSELGAGFKIAMRDLEIRGAGNLLGTEQSGHIAAVGYELYCQLLENAVRALKHEPLREHRHVEVDLPGTALVPNSYIPPGRFKIEMYRKLTAVQSEEQLEDIRQEFRDRYGPLPPEVERLLEIRSLQLIAVRWQIDGIRLEHGYVIFSYRNPRKITKLAKASPHPIRILDDREASSQLPPRLDLEEDLVPWLKLLLQPEAV